MCRRCCQGHLRADFTAIDEKNPQGEMMGILAQIDHHVDCLSSLSFFLAEGLKKELCAEKRAENCSVGGTCKGRFQSRNSLVDDDGLFVPGSAILKILDDNQPIRRRLCFPS
jgi:hypothetical protein